MSGGRLARGALQTIGAAALIAFALAVYFVAAHHPPYPPLPTRTSLDDLVPIWPAFIYVYLSPYLAGPLVAGLLSRELYRRMLTRVATLLPLQLGAYFAVPTIVVRPHAPVGDGIGDALVRAIYLVDTPPANAAPSGHVSLALMLAWAAWNGMPRARFWSALYFGLVIVSILFTGQHHVVDLVTGALLGGLVLGAVSLRERRT